MDSTEKLSILRSLPGWGGVYISNGIFIIANPNLDNCIDLINQLDIKIHIKIEIILTQSYVDKLAQLKIHKLYIHMIFISNSINSILNVEELQFIGTYWLRGIKYKNLSSIDLDMTGITEKDEECILHTIKANNITNFRTHHNLKLFNEMLDNMKNLKTIEIYINRENNKYIINYIRKSRVLRDFKYIIFDYESYLKITSVLKNNITIINSDSEHAYRNRQIQDNIQKSIIVFLAIKKYYKIWYMIPKEIIKEIAKYLYSTRHELCWMKSSDRD
jgi:hypothetical protein